MDRHTEIGVRTPAFTTIKLKRKKRRDWHFYYGNFVPLPNVILPI